MIGNIKFKDQATASFFTEIKEKDHVKEVIIHLQNTKMSDIKKYQQFVRETGREPSVNELSALFSHPRNRNGRKDHSTAGGTSPRDCYPREDKNVSKTFKSRQRRDGNRTFSIVFSYFHRKLSNEFFSKLDYWREAIQLYVTRPEILLLATREKIRDGIKKKIIKFVSLVQEPVRSAIKQITVRRKQSYRKQHNPHAEPRWRKRVKVSPQQLKITKVLEQNHSLSADQIVNSTRIRQNSIRMQLKRLLDLDVIKQLNDLFTINSDVQAVC